MISACILCATLSAPLLAQGEAPPQSPMADGGGSCEAETASLRARVKELEDELAKSHGLRKLASTEGYQAAKWGMSTAEVRKLYPKAKDNEGTLVLDSNVTNRDALIAFHFAANKLVGAVVLFKQTFVNANNHLIDYEQLKDLLTKKYGSPNQDETIWKNDLYKDDPQHWGMAVSAGHLVKYAVWETQRTKVKLSCRGENFHVSMAIVYRSRELEDLQKSVREAKELSDL